MLRPKSYVALVLGLCLGILAPACALGLALSTAAYRVDKNRLASEWQQATHGVTYAPPISLNRPFKTLRLLDRMSEADTIVFGSSTMMGVRQEAFPAGHTVYNFAQSGNPLRSMIGEARYIVGRWGERVKLLVIPLDWALGFVQQPDAPIPADLSAASVASATAAIRPSWRAELIDALSLPRLKILAGVLRDIARAPDRRAAFRGYFVDAGGPEYRCADGTPARDFDFVYRGLCNGFRYDGSATFAAQKPLREGEVAATLAAAVAGGSQYAVALQTQGGEPNPALLAALADLAHRVDRHGGRVLFLVPPLLPGVEAHLAATPHSRALLSRTKHALEAWAARERLTLLDAGRSERFGCQGVEFIDPHHALPECHRKVFARFFAVHREFAAVGAARPPEPRGTAEAHASAVALPSSNP
ncbi:MAG: hypothetical protein IT515_14165 [Burkholderiales bacterium]|nr:hypothetical protein [Burkholderiales bacterium]